MEHEMKIIDGHVHLVQYIAGTGAGGELRFAGNGMAEYASLLYLDLVWFFKRFFISFDVFIIATRKRFVNTFYSFCPIILYL